jgi:hypothetical protein
LLAPQHCHRPPTTALLLRMRWDRNSNRNRCSLPRNNNNNITIIIILSRRRR